MKEVDLTSPTLRMEAVTTKPSSLPPQVVASTKEVSETRKAANVRQDVSPSHAERAVNVNTGDAKALQSSQQQKRQQVELAVTKLNEFVQAQQRDLRFDMDSASGRTVITVVDRKSEEVVRQIPDELALKLAQSLNVEDDIHLLNIQA
ncbi:flagellar protein FlaG [Endozoicomonas sp. SM1973]|uniref:Flagellar protein FlaG n=1 Tax=Spartinivicinus marinus TaxID=2994442 RepID=A0A853HUC7_9GAMM|nr:flagellar protein FlaG [Spartinivicinus marinus]MCX4029884.1 flagellar protein FlaG [Spartinivicinus marinus]NYZ64873.1 flagellar protein FlaG [Spartinivicinus marinus]